MAFVPLAFLLSAFPDKKPLTVGEAVTHPHPPEIIPIWSPDGKFFAYEDENKIRLYDVSARKSKVWFETEKLEKLAVARSEKSAFGWQNRRVSSNNYQWFPNGKELLAEVNGDLFIVSASGKIDQVTRTPTDEEDPKLSPDGSEILYRTNSNLYVLDLSTRKTRQLTNNGTVTLLNGRLDWVYPEELDLGTATWWSPDSKQIAYFQFDVSGEFVYPQVHLLGERAISEPERYPQAGTPNASVKLGVIPAAGGETRWMDVGETSNTLLARVAWLPDSTAIAVERFSRLQNQLDLLFCNPASGSAKTVIHEQSKTWINVADNILFLKTRPEFLWTSERTGFRHIYRYSNSGELLGQLTTGGWEVKTLAALDESKGLLYYTSSEATPLETHLYSVPLTGGDRTLLTLPGYSHEIHASKNGACYIDDFSSLTHPHETILRSIDNREIAVLQKADIEDAAQYEILPTEMLHLQTSDGTTLYGRLIKPAGFKPGTRYPTLVSVYGGPGVQVVRNEWDGISLEQALAQRGYLVWQLDNRGSIGRGHAFEEPVFRNLGAQEVADQRFGVEYLIKAGLADPARIGIFGWSYGGYMTIHSLLFAPDLFKVGVAGAPVTDWHNYDTIYTERYMGLPDENSKQYDATSNVKNAEKLSGKLLIIHNIEDDNVLFQNTMQLLNALEHAEKRYWLQIYPGRSHGVGGPLRRPLYETLADFFDENLKGAH